MRPYKTLLFVSFKTPVNNAAGSHSTRSGVRSMARLFPNETSTKSQTLGNHGNHDTSLPSHNSILLQSDWPPF